MEETLKDLRALMLGERARELRQFTDDARSEDELTTLPRPDGKDRKVLTIKRALEVALDELERNKQIIDLLTRPSS